MTKKDYVAIARVLKIARDNFREDADGKAIQSRDYILGRGAESAIGIVAEALTYVFAEDNDLFDRVRFLKACGIVEEL